MTTPESILPNSEHIQKMRRDLWLKLGLITIAGAGDEVYEEQLQELREFESELLNPEWRIERE